MTSTLRLRKWVVREGLWVVIAQVVVALSTILGVRVITGLVQPSVYGAIVLSVGVVILFQQLASGPILQVAQRQYPLYVDAEGVGVLRAGVESALWFRTAIGAAIAGVGVALWTTRAGESLLLGPVCALLLVTDVICATQISFLNAGRDQKAMAIVVIVRSIARVAGAVAVALLVGASATSIVAGYVLGNVLALAGERLLRLARGDDPRFDAQPGSSVLRVKTALLEYAKPLRLLPAVSWATGQADRYMLGGTMGLGAAGLYSSVYGLASFPFIALGAALDSGLRPPYYDCLSRGDSPRARRVLRTWLGTASGTSLLLVGLFVLLHDQIAYLVLAPAYRSGASLMVPIAAGYALLVCTQVLGRVCFAYHDTTSVARIEWVGAAASIAVGLVMILLWGVGGAAWAVPVYFGIQLIFAAIVVWRPLSDELEGGRFTIGSHNNQ